MTLKNDNSPTRRRLIEVFEAAFRDRIISSYNVPPLNKRSCGRFKRYKPIIDGIEFDSGMEAEYYVYLLKAGVKFKRQQSFELLPKYKINGRSVRAITYVADFVIYDDNDKLVRVIDIKGRATEAFKIKKKLFEYIFGVDLECVARSRDGRWIHT